MLKLKAGEYVGILYEVVEGATLETSPCIRATARQALEDAKALAKASGRDESYCYVQDVTGILYEYDPSLEAPATFCMRHIPTDRPCDVDSDGVCWVTFSTREAAAAHIASKIDPQWRANYEPMPLPTGLKVAPVPTVEQTLGDLTYGEQQAVKLADKVVLGASWFALVDGTTVTGLMDGDQIDYDHMQAVDSMLRGCATAGCRIQMEESARRAELMLQAVAQPEPGSGFSVGANPAAIEAALVFAAGLGGAALEC